LKLLLRLGVAGVFFKSGLTKIASWEFTVLLFRDEYKVPVLPPEVAAALATTAELTCPVLLVLGLATRLTTLPLLGMTAIIQIFVFPESWVDHLMWTAMLLVLLTRGPGAISLDRFLAPLVLGPKGR
jgi:putative oxidoreductase